MTEFDAKARAEVRQRCEPYLADSDSRGWLAGTCIELLDALDAAERERGELRSEVGRLKTLLAALDHAYSFRAVEHPIRVLERIGQFIDPLELIQAPEQARP